MIGSTAIASAEAASTPVGSRGLDDLARYFEHEAAQAPCSKGSIEALASRTS
jgi:hypothetical protein